MITRARQNVTRLIKVTRIRWAFHSLGANNLKGPNESKFQRMRQMQGKVINGRRPTWGRFGIIAG